MSANTIEAEARWMMQKSATLFGAKILQSQIEKGLSKWATQTLENIDSTTSDEIKSQCEAILKRSNIAGRIIQGVKIAIAGPPNSGKSTLLNCLAGQQQVIVSETAGTTRDWVSITCTIADRAGMEGSVIQAEFIDTAGLDDILTADNPVEQAAQGMARRILEHCDLVLYVQDITAVRSQQTENTCHVDKPVIYVYNKCDLIQQSREPEKQEYQFVPISAKNNNGIDVLMQAITNVLETADFDPAQPVVFTERQSEIVCKMFHTIQPLRSLLDKLLFSQGN
jgi:tRNA modification GTPase